MFSSWRFPHTGVSFIPDQGRRQRGGQWCPAPPIWNLCPPILRLASWLLHTSNTVFLKCGPPSGFWPLQVFGRPLLLNPGDGPVPDTGYKHTTRKKRQTVALCWSRIAASIHPSNKSVSIILWLLNANLMTTNWNRYAFRNSSPPERTEPMPHTQKHATPRMLALKSREPIHTLQQTWFRCTP